MDSSRETDREVHGESSGGRRGRTDWQGQQRRQNPRKSAAGPALHPRDSQTETKPPALAYVSVPAHVDPDLQEELLAEARKEMADFLARSGLTLTGMFADVQGHSDAGLYGLVEAVRRGEASTVVVPELSHLLHSGCLAGADARTAARYLRARLLIARTGQDGRHHARPEMPPPAWAMAQSDRPAGTAGGL